MLLGDNLITKGFQNIGMGSRVQSAILNIIAHKDTSSSVHGQSRICELVTMWRCPKTVRVRVQVDARCDRVATSRTA